MNAKGISGDASYTLRLKLIQAAKLDNSGWSIVGCDSEEPKEAEWSDSPIAGLAQAAIDGDLTTFWHTQWDKAQPGYPHWFIVDMGREYVISSFVCYRRQGNSGGQTEHKFEVSLNGNDWTDMGTFAFDSQKDAGQMYTMVLLPEARYFRYTATKGPNHYAFLSEIEVYGAPIE
nr:discoidin domain-containing protein [Bacteroides xylanisolvens]